MNKQEKEKLKQKVVERVDLAISMLYREYGEDSQLAAAKVEEYLVDKIVQLSIEKEELSRIILKNGVR